MQKHLNLVELLVKSFPTNIFLQNLASIQKRTSPIKFAHLAEKSEDGSISNLSTKRGTALPAPATVVPRSADSEKPPLQNLSAVFPNAGLSPAFFPLRNGDAKMNAFHYVNLFFFSYFVFHVSFF